MIKIIKLKTDRSCTTSFFCSFTGGQSVIVCLHGIVYSVKFNLRAQIPRDWTDLLLLQKHFPSFSVYYVAHGSAAHANLPVPVNPPFQPHEGRIADLTKENADATICQKFKVHLPWLFQRLQHPEGDQALNQKPFIKGSSQHYVLYDKFQQSNTKDEGLIPELQGIVRLQSIFAALPKNNFYLINMGPSSHIFLMHIIEHGNNLLNEKLLNYAAAH